MVRSRGVAPLYAASQDVPRHHERQLPVGFNVQLIELADERLVSTRRHPNANLAARLFERWVVPL